MVAGMFKIYSLNNGRLTADLSFFKKKKIPTETCKLETVKQNTFGNAKKHYFIEECSNKLRMRT